MAADSAALRERLVAATPMGRMGTPEDAARLIAWLCSPAAGWVTGQTIVSDGGYSLVVMETAEPYPRFSDAELERAARGAGGRAREAGVEHALVYGANRTGSAVGWLTRWPVTREALVVHTPGERDVLLVNFYNHVPNAERIATDADVRWAGPQPMETAIEELRRRGAAGRRSA